MITPEQIEQVTKHGLSHQVEYCRCPCYQALIDVGLALKKEKDFQISLAKASPEVLAAILIGDDDGRDPEQGDRDDTDVDPWSSSESRGS